MTKKEQIKKAENLLKDRIDIVESFDNRADKILLNGMVVMLNAMGYEYIHTDNGIKVIPL